MTTPWQQLGLIKTVTREHSDEHCWMCPQLWNVFARSCVLHIMHSCVSFSTNDFSSYCNSETPDNDNNWITYKAGHRHAHICVRNILKLKQTRAHMRTQHMRTQHMEVETHTRTYAYSTYRKSSNKDRDSFRGRASDSSRGRGRYRQIKAEPRIQARGKIR